MIVMSLTMCAVFLGIATAAAITLSLYSKKGHVHGKNAIDYKSSLYSKGTVVCDASLCSKIGVDILKANGSAVDSAIAASLCLSVVNMYATGIGGGGFMLVYIRENKTFLSLDFRERAPGKSTVDMFEGKVNNSRYGGKSIGVPGQVKGLYTAWKRFGRLPWRQLVDTAITIAMDGFPVQPMLNTVITLSQPLIYHNIGLRNLLFTSSYQSAPIGSLLKDHKLATTLKMIRDDPESFYTGNLAAQVVKDVSTAGGDITLDDLAKYEVITRPVLSTVINEFNFSTMGLPSGGVSVIQFINILRGYFLTPDDMDSTDTEKSAKTYHRIIEALKFTYAEKSKLGDPDFTDKALMNKHIENALDENFGESLRHKIDEEKTHDVQYYGPEYDVPKDYGTSHVSVVASNGDAVAMTTSINEWFGSLYRSTESGIIYNNVMADFAVSKQPVEGLLPPSKQNKIHRGKTPLSSMSPVIMTDQKSGDVKFVIGGTGGGRIIPSVALSIINKLWFGKDLAHSIAQPRVYHQLLPNVVEIEEGHAPSQQILEKLKKKGHKFSQILPMKTSAQAIYVEKPGKIYGMSDPRRDGLTYGY